MTNFREIFFMLLASEKRRNMSWYFDFFKLSNIGIDTSLKNTIAAQNWCDAPPMQAKPIEHSITKLQEKIIIHICPRQ